MTLLCSLTAHYSRLWLGTANHALDAQLSARAQDKRLAVGLLAAPVLTTGWWLPFVLMADGTPSLMSLALAVIAFVIGLRLMLDLPLYTSRAMPLLGGLACLLMVRGEHQAFIALRALMAG